MATKDNGYIKLHRKLIDWEWWGHPVETLIFIYFLCTASYTPIVIDGKKYPAGTVETTLSDLQREFKCFSVRNIRTALDHLQTSSEIVRKSTNKKSVITIVKWRKYQLSNLPSDKQVTSKRQATDKPPIKKVRKKEEYTLSQQTRACAREEKETGGLGEYENVFLSDNEKDELRNINRLEWMNYVFKLSEYMKQTGKTYASHFAVIKAWMYEDGVAT